jgi:hypothetical protein
MDFLIAVNNYARYFQYIFSLQISMSPVTNFKHFDIRFRISKDKISLKCLFYQI